MSDDANPCSAAGPAAVTGAARPRYGEVTIRNRGRLPHWEKDAGLYFITFRLADSLPKHIRNALRKHRELLKTAGQSGRELLPVEAELARQMSTKSMERYLDAGGGSCVLRDARIASVVAETLTFWDETRYRLHAWCVMPNHVHAVVRLLPGIALEAVVGTWKSYTAKRANQLLGRSGTFWMREYYDRLIRDGSEFDRAVAYVLANPERAGLKDWPWLGTAMFP